MISLNIGAIVWGIGEIGCGGLVLALGFMLVWTFLKDKSLARKSRAPQLHADQKSRGNKGMILVLLFLAGAVIFVGLAEIAGYRVFPKILGAVLAWADNHFWLAFLLWVFAILPAITIIVVIPLWSRTMAKLGIGRRVYKIAFACLPGSRILIPTIETQEKIETQQTTKPMGWRDAFAVFKKKDAHDDFANNRRWHFFIGAFAVTLILAIWIPRPSGMDYTVYSVKHNTIGERTTNGLEDARYHALHGCNPAHGCDDGSPNYRPPKHEPLTPVASPWGFFQLASLVLFFGLVIPYGVWAEREEFFHGIAKAWAKLGELHKDHNEKAKRGWEAQKATYDNATRGQQDGKKGKGKGQQTPLPPKPADKCPSFSKWSVVYLFASEIAAEFFGEFIEHLIHRRRGSTTAA